MKMKTIYEDELFIRVEYSNMKVLELNEIFEFIIKNQKHVLNVHLCRGYSNLAHFTIKQIKEFLNLTYTINKGFNDKFYLSSKYFTLIFDNMIVEYDKKIKVGEDK